MTDDGFENVDGSVDPVTSRRVKAVVVALALVALLALVGHRLVVGDDEVHPLEDQATDVVRLLTPECVNHVLGQWGRGDDLAVFMHLDASEPEIAAVRDRLEQAVGAENVSFVDQQAAYDEFVVVFRDQPGKVAKASPEILPGRFRVHAGDDQVISELTSSLSAAEGVREIVPRQVNVDVLLLADPDTDLATDRIYVVVYPRDGTSAVALVDQVSTVVGATAFVHAASGAEVVVAEAPDHSIGAVLALLGDLYDLDGAAAAEISSQPAPPVRQVGLDGLDENSFLSCIGPVIADDLVDSD